MLNLRGKEQCAWDVLSLGEVMVRFDPGEQRIATTRTFRVWEGGGEYNVARALRRCFRQRSTVVTALVDNSVGRLLEDLMLQGGVDLSHVLWKDFDGIGREARNGVYFLERGFGSRPAMGMMDRAHTAVSQLQPGTVDWDSIFGNEGVRWFHTGGIMCALSDTSADVVREAMAAAKRHGVIVSYDCNYRPSLWRDKGGRLAASRMNRALAPMVDVLLGHDGDLAAEVCAASGGPPWHTAESYAAMAERIVTDFPNIQSIATTVRRVHTANRNDWGAFGWMGGEVRQSMEFPNLEILDRVGGGDAFAAGLFYGLMEGNDLKWSLDCGVAHGALAMTTAGDASVATLAEVIHAMDSKGTHVQR